MENIFIISGPSGAGEDSIIKGLKKLLPIEVITTTTTRDMRDGESEGCPYYFTSKEKFKNSIKNEEFYEWAEEDNSNFYGVTKKEIDRVKKSAKTGIWKIDYKGVINAKKLLPDIKIIFINAPEESLRQRLKLRDNSDDDFIERRMEYAKGWYGIKHLYDYEILNEDGKLEESIQKVYEIIKTVE